jgi:hypothetical protein
LTSDENLGTENNLMSTSEFYMIITANLNYSTKANRPTCKPINLHCTKSRLFSLDWEKIPIFSSVTPRMVEDLIKHLTQQLTLLSLNLVPFSNFSRDNKYPERGASQISLVTPGICLVSGLSTNPQTQRKPTQKKTDSIF